MLELAHVSLPFVRAERAVGVGGEGPRLALQACGGRGEEVLDQERQVLDPLAQRRQQDRDDVQPVVEVLAEAARFHLGLEVLVGGREDAHVDLERAVAADPLELALLQDAQDLGLRLRLHVADLVEKECPAVGDLELALARRDGPREGALLVTEELALDQLARERRAVHLDERLRAPRAVVVERVGDQLLPRAARAADEDRQIRVRHLADHVEHALHRRALADQAPEAIRARDLLLQEPERAPHLHAVEQALDDQLELVVVEGLGDVVGGAQLHRLDGDLLRAEGGDHDDRRLRRVLAHPAQHLHAAHALQAEVGDDEVVAGLREPPEGLLAREHGIDLVPARAEQALDGDADRALVVDDQDAAPHGASASGKVTRTVRPAPSAGAATIAPPCASTAWRAIASPSPVPVCFKEKKGSKRRGSASAGTPGPLSVTDRVATPCPLPTATVTRRGEEDIASASRAFSSRFKSTWRSLSRSARASTPGGPTRSAVIPAASSRGRSASSVARASSPRSTGSKRNSSRRAKRSSPPTCRSTRSSSSRMSRCSAAHGSPGSRASCCARLRAAVTGFRISCAMRAASSPSAASFSACASERSTASARASRSAPSSRRASWATNARNSSKSSSRNTPPSMPVFMKRWPQRRRGLRMGAAPSVTRARTSASRRASGSARSSMLPKLRAGSASAAAPRGQTCTSGARSNSPCAIASPSARMMAAPGTPRTRTSSASARRQHSSVPSSGDSVWRNAWSAACCWRLRRRTRRLIAARSQACPGMNTSASARAVAKWRMGRSCGSRRAASAVCATITPPAAASSVAVTSTSGMTTPSTRSAHGAAMASATPTSSRTSPSGVWPAAARARNATAETRSPPATSATSGRRFSTAPSGPHAPGRAVFHPSLRHSTPKVSPQNRANDSPGAPAGPSSTRASVRPRPALAGGP